MAASDEPIRILVDSRETRSPVLEALRGTPRAAVEVVELEVGDYVIAEGQAIERKTAIDLVQSIQDGRFIGQTELMKSGYIRSYLLIEGNPWGVRTQMNSAAITGAISHAAVNCNMTVITTSGAQQTAEMIYTAARHASEGLGYVPPLRGGKPKDALLLARYLVEGLPGIGAASASTLLRHFGSAHAVFVADVDSLRKVKGIGAKTAERIVEVLRANVLDLHP